MAPRLPQLGKFGRREKMWTVAFAAVTIGIIGYRAALRPRAQAVGEARRSVEKLESELIKLEADRPDLEARRVQLDKTRTGIQDMLQELEQLEEGLLNRHDQDVLLEQVVAKRANLQVQINAVKPLKEEPKKGADKDRDAEPEFYKRLFMQIDGYAGFDDLISYVKALEAHSPYQRVQSVAIKVEGQDTVRPRALVLTETLLASAPEQVEKRRAEVFGTLESLAKQRAKDPFVPLEKPKEEQPAVGLELSGVFGSGTSLTALINGEPYQVGQTIQGKRVVEIHPDRVVLEQGSRRFLLYGQQGAE